MARPVVWLAVEVHCYVEPVGQVSIWISGCPLSDDKSAEEDVAVRLVGPVSTAERDRNRRRRPEQLEAAGVTVIQSAAADA